MGDFSRQFPGFLRISSVDCRHAIGVELAGSLANMRAA
jgi:hypothetical protein